MFPFLLNWSPQMRGIIHYERRLFFTQCLKSGKRRHNNHHHFIMCCWCLPKVKLLSSVTVPIQNCILSLDIIYDVCNWKQSQRSNLSCRLQRDQIWRNFTTLAKLWKSLGNFSKLNLVLEKNQQSLVKLVCFWANLHCCKWPNIENNLVIWSHWSDQKSADILNDTGLNIVLLCIVFGNCYFTFWFPPKQCDEKIPPNIFTSCPKMISQEKW